MYNTYIYSIWYHIAVLELGSANLGWIGWISFRLFEDFKEIEISASVCALFLVELVELMYNSYSYLIWKYLVISELGIENHGWIGWISFRSL